MSGGLRAQTADPWDLATVWRPVQYLGSKLNLLPQLAPHLRLDRPGTTLDLFSGSSVVGQLLAARGPVLGRDSQAFAGILFDAAICLRGQPVPALRGLVREPLRLPRDGVEAEERRRVAQGDQAGLVALYQRLHRSFQAEYDPTAAWWAERVDAEEPRLLAAHYGGHYFGISQAHDLDAIIARVRQLDDPERTIGLCCVLGVMSRVASSAGKHFAQPLNFLEGGANHFVAQRLLTDRRFDVRQEFARQLDRFSLLKPRPGSAGSMFAVANLSNGIDPHDADVAYLDPPYTVDQYSRFYHVLEVAVTGTPFRLALPGGAPTKGRYPEDRQQSAFSSPRRAAPAFDRLLGSLASKGLRCVISYSQPGTAQGRERTITMERLTELCQSYFASVETFSLAHTYRPLQPRQRKRPSSEEVLLVCH